MSAAAAGAQALTAKQVRSYIMRTTGPQQFFTQTFSTLGTFNIPKNIPLLLPLAYIMIRVKGRYVVGAASFVPSPEAPQNIIQQVRLIGTHATLGQLTPIQASGATLFALNRVFGVRGNSYIDTGTRFAELGKPMGFTQAQFGTTATTHDFELFYTIPVFPYNVPDEQAIQYLYNAAAWGQTLQLQIVTADGTAWNTTAGNITFSAFGSGAGSPSIDIMLVYASLGPLATSIQQAVRVLNVTSLTSVLQANSNGVRLALLQNQRTLNVIQKTGTSQAGVSAGVSAFGTLSDTQTEQTILRTNNNPIRNLQFNDATAEFYGYRFDTVMPTGYLNLSFTDSNPLPNVHTGFRGEKLPGGTQFDIATNVVGAGGTNIGEIIQDMVYGEPVIAGQS